MRSDPLPPVAIIGGGFSGTAMLAELTRRGIKAVLIEGGGRAGEGAAYSTDDPAHLLNVRADVMSARADDADHFARYIESEGGHRHEFAERRQYGRYLKGELEAAVAGGGIVIPGQAVDAAPTAGGWTVQLANGEMIEARALVLAIGNQEPEPLRAFGDAGPRYVNNPWSAAARRAEAEAVAAGADVLLIGTGLTMVDTALSLDAAGHQGAILAVSRRGLLPRGHAERPGPPAPVERAELPLGNLLALWRWLRRRAGAVDWRSAVDALRPHSHAIWQGFDQNQRRRFLRHARPWWDVHRHRIAPQVARTIRGMISDGRLEIAAARLTSARDTGDGIEVDYIRRGSITPETRRFGHVFNCTGPLHAINRTRDPLLRGLMARSIVRPDALNIALEVDGQARPVGSGRLWALGPMTKGRYWEITAVPDIRAQVATVADDIAKELGA